MTINIQKIAHLAQLQIAPSEIDYYHQELSKIFKLIEEMMEIDVSDIKPMTHPFETMPIMRPDEVTESIVENGQFEKLQRLAPKVDQGLYLVPQVIE